MDTDGFHQQCHPDQYFVGMFQHQPVVCSQIWFTFNSINDDPLYLASWWRRQFNVSRETGTTHTDNACILNFGNDFFIRQFRTVFYLHQISRAVYGFIPHIILNLYIYGRFRISAGIYYCVNFEDCTAH